MSINRRTFTKNSAAALLSFSLASFAAAPASSEQQLKFVCVGGHPDDPESGCGGTLAKLTSAGHNVTIIYLTRGEAGIPGKPHAEAAAIRTREAEAASRILRAKAIFAGQVDGDTIVNNEWVEKMNALLASEEPDVVFTHWPIDQHKDHQVASLLTIQSWMRLGRSFPLYFFEVCTGSQTTGFHPTDFVDISAYQEQKRRAVYCHTSQNPDGIYLADDCNHAAMEQFRGIEINARAAEAFVKMDAASSW